MLDTEKAKRKAKPHRRSRLFIGSGIILTISLLVILTWLVFMWTGVLCGCSPTSSEQFEFNSTQIAVTNAYIETRIAETEVAATKHLCNNDGSSSLFLYWKNGQKWCCS